MAIYLFLFLIFDEGLGLVILIRLVRICWDGFVMDWHWIDIGLASDWNGLALDCSSVDIGLASDWHRIGIRLGLDWHRLTMDLYWIGDGLAMDWRPSIARRPGIDNGLALDWYWIGNIQCLGLSLDWYRIGIGIAQDWPRCTMDWRDFANPKWALDWHWIGPGLAHWHCIGGLTLSWQR